MADLLEARTPSFSLLERQYILRTIGNAKTSRNGARQYTIYTSIKTKILSVSFVFHFVLFGSIQNPLKEQ